MHILVANNIYPPIMAGGAERIVAYLCEGLVGRGHRVTVVSTCGPEMEPYPVETRNGVEVIRFFPPNVYWSFERPADPGPKKWVWHARDAWNLAAAKRFRAILGEARPDILHTHLIDGFSAAIWARARRAGIPVIHTAHDYHLLCPRAFMLTADWKLCTRPRLPCQLYRSWHLRTTRHVDLFTSPSRFLIDMHRRAGLRSVGEAVVHNGIPLPEDGAEIRRGRPAEAVRRFLMLTRLTPEKGIGTVLEAVARLPESLPIEVAIAGRGPMEEQVRQAASRDRHIAYLGFLDGQAKSEALTRSGHLLLPSLWYENAPVTIVEAAAYGLSLIGSDIGGIPEFVEPGRTGFLFPPGDSAALAGLIETLARNPDALPGLDRHSQALAERFSVTRMIDRFESHYAALIAGPAALAAQ